MVLNPVNFSKASVIDTCSVWNILSSRKLYQSTLSANLHFCITGVVLYECLYKPRSNSSVENVEMMERLKSDIQSGGFPVEPCSLDDLAVVSNLEISGLGSGELSCMAVAYRVRNIAIMTDDQQARKVASNNLKLTVETTPYLYAWLYYRQYLSDSDHSKIITEHETYRTRPLTTFLQQAYEEAMRFRLMDRSKDKP